MAPENNAVSEQNTAPEHAVMPEDKTCRIAVVGAGLIGQTHVRHVLKEATLASIVDPNPASAALASEHGVRHYLSIESMLEADTPDGVLLATPTGLHVEQALTCLRAGIPTLVEKPIADTVESAQTLVDASLSLNVPVLVGHHRRYNPLIRAAHEQISEGALGDIVSMNALCWLRKPDDYFDVAWRRTSAAGPLLINLIHDIDLMRHLCGDIVSVQARQSSHTRGLAVEDTAALLLEFDSGALGTMSVSDAIVSPWSWELTAGENQVYPKTDQSCYLIGGTHSSLSIPDATLWRNEQQRGWHEPMIQTAIAFEAVDPLSLQVRHFKDVIAGRAKPLVSAQDGLEALRVIEAAKESAISGQQVALNK